MSKTSAKRAFSFQDEGEDYASKKPRSGPKLRDLKESDRRRTNDDVHESITLCPVMVALIDTPQFQRLRELKQLGTADRVYMNANHNRFEHSIGVAHLAERLCQRLKDNQRGVLKCTKKDILCVKLAGLLHDIGHGPFSHAYESFVSTSHPEYLEKSYGQLHNDSSDYLKILKEDYKVPEGWKHEEASLMMIDTLLANIGLAIDEQNLDKPLQSIDLGHDGAVNPMSMRTFERDCNGDLLPADEAVLTSRDFVFIKECIWGGPIPGMNNTLEGRSEWQKEWLYGIVSNWHSGLDVDKMDYFARDSRSIEKQGGQVDEYMIEEAVVAWGDCTNPRNCPRCINFEGPPEKQGKHLMICYPTKGIDSVIRFFHRRFDMHSKLYQHKTVAAARLMIMDILCYADPYFRISTSSSGDSSMEKKPALDSVPVSRAFLFKTAYTNLDDNVINLIFHSDHDKLGKAKDLIARYKRRDLYKCAHSLNINPEDKSHNNLWELSDDEIKKGLLRLDGRYREDGEEVKVEEEDIIVERVSIHHGQKDKNPLDNMRFVERHNRELLISGRDLISLPDAVTAESTKYQASLPKIQQQRIVRLFCRDKNTKKYELLRHLFDQFIEASSVSMTTSAPQDPEAMCVSQELADEDAEDSNHDSNHDNIFNSPSNIFNSPTTRFSNV